MFFRDTIKTLMLKSYIRRRLEGYVKKYFKRHTDVKLVVVTGSVGKTSTKIAIATVLSERLRVRLHEGNHNSELSAPVAMLGVAFPENVRSLRQWSRVFKAMRRRIKQPTDVDVVIQELGTDGVGQIPAFGRYLKPDIAVVTAVSPEHMEFFKTMDAVAAEELSAVNFSQQAFINRDDIDGEYAKYIQNPSINTYGSTSAAEYRFDTSDIMANDGFFGSFSAPDLPGPIEVNLHLAGEHSIRAAVAAGAVAIKCGLTPEEIARGMEKIRPVPGRMNLLKGMKDSIIIDDSYNSSPLAAQSALRALYHFDTPQRIAVLGSMNELGEQSIAEHQALGRLCDPVEIDHVVTVGDQAAQYLAPEAKKRGCQVKSFKSPLSAGAYVNSLLDTGSVVLFKGSQGGVFLEEAIKVILSSPDDYGKLVRQSDEWMKTKQKFFDTLTPGE